MKHHILISLGSNINKEENTQNGLDALYACFDSLSLSTIYESESVGFIGNNFLNLVVSAKTNEAIPSVCKILKKIEDEHGRTRDVKFGNRTLDLDLLTFDDVVCDTPIVLPRAEIEYNAFVLKPMAELVPNMLHPISKVSYADLWQDFKKNNPNRKQRLWPSTCLLYTSDAADDLTRVDIVVGCVSKKNRKSIR